MSKSTVVIAVVVSISLVIAGASIGVVAYRMGQKHEAAKLSWFGRVPDDKAKKAIELENARSLATEDALKVLYAAKAANDQETIKAALKDLEYIQSSKWKPPIKKKK